MKKTLSLIAALFFVNLYLQAQTDSTRVANAPEEVITNEPSNADIDKELVDVNLYSNLADAEYQSWDIYYNNMLAQSYITSSTDDQSWKVKRRGGKKEARTAYYSYPKTKSNPD